MYEGPFNLIGYFYPIKRLQSRQERQLITSFYAREIITIKSRRRLSFFPFYKKRSVEFLHFSVTKRDNEANFWKEPWPTLKVVWHIFLGKCQKGTYY